jgi:hypothetical protein
MMISLLERSLRYETRVSVPATSTYHGVAFIALKQKFCNSFKMKANVLGKLSRWSGPYHLVDLVLCGSAQWSPTYHRRKGEGIVVLVLDY